MRNPDEPKVTVIGCEAEIGCQAKKSPATLDWWHVVWLFLSCGLLLVSSSPSDYKSSGSSEHKPHHHDKVADHGGANNASQGKLNLKRKQTNRLNFLTEGSIVIQTEHEIKSLVTLWHIWHYSTHVLFSRAY